MKAQKTDNDLVVIARKQRNLLMVFCMYLLCVGLNVVLTNTPFALYSQLAIFAFAICVVCFCSILAFELFGKASASVLTILSLIPLLNLIAFLIVNTRANKILKSHGLRVGLIGANLSEIDSKAIDV